MNNVLHSLITQTESFGEQYLILLFYKTVKPDLEPIRLPIQ